MDIMKTVLFVTCSLLGTLLQDLGVNASWSVYDRRQNYSTDL